MTRRMLIVSPHFPPVNAPDMQRIRQGLPYFSGYDWEIHVLAAANDGSAQSIEPRLLETVPDRTPITRVQPIPSRFTNWFGLRNLGWRSWFALFRAGLKLLRSQRFDVVYFSTTLFIVLPMGRLWRRLCGVPYVIDLQDPWLNDYYFENPTAARPGGAKYLLAHASAWLLEAWTLRRCAGIISVSEAYPKVLRRRYPWLRDRPMTVIPFGVDERDLALLRRKPMPQDLFTPRDGCAHIVSIGRGGDDLLKAIRALFSSVTAVASVDPVAGERLRIHFAGTNYAAAGQAQPMFLDLARACGVAGQFTERPWRLGYFESLQCQLDASAIVVLGSDDPSYSPSKLYSVLLTGKPVVAVVLAGSLLEARVPRSPQVRMLTYDATGRVINGLDEVIHLWRQLAAEAALPADREPAALAAPDPAVHARTLTRTQLEFIGRATESEKKEEVCV